MSKSLTHPIFKNITGIVLAGGESRRMGRHKAAIEIDGIPLLKKSVSLFKKVFPEVIAISKEPGSFGDVGCKEVGDLFSGRGPMVGILTAFKVTSSDYIFVAACDMPFLNTNVIDLIIREGQGFDITLPKIGEKSDPLHALYSRNCFKEMLSFMENEGRSLNRFIDSLEKSRVRYITEDEIRQVDGDALSLFNMNTPEELEKAKKLLSGDK